jgi:enoyl-CoA hydratase/carnithine racemase
MDFRSIAVEVAPDGVALLSLARPARLNAIDIAMRREISACLAAWRDDPAVRAVVVTGQGRAFSAGFDLAEFGEPALHEEILRSSTAYHRDIWYFPKPTIAAVNGPAVGGGFDLATLCDLRIGTEEAWFSHPEIAHGAPPLFSPLRWLVGDAVARDLCLTRRKVKAGEALALHLLREVVPAGGLLEAARALARLVLEAPEEAIRFTKERMARSAGQGFDEVLAEEHDRAFREILLVPGRFG